MQADAPFGWRAANVDGTHGFNAVSCASTSFCAAVDGAGNVATSISLTGGAAAWKVSAVDPSAETGSEFDSGLRGVSCPSASLCVAVDVLGNVVTSTNPSGGTAAWKVSNIDPSAGGGGELSGVSCPSASLCVAVDTYGNIFTSTNPTGGAAAWTETQNVVSDDFKGVSCPSTSLCAAVTFGGKIVTSTNPTGGASAWNVAQVETTAFGTIFAVSCASTSLCVAVDQNNSVLSSANPTGGQSAWTFAAEVDPGALLESLSCPSTVFCVIADGGGNVVISTNPGGGAAAWTVSQVGNGNNSLSDVSCPSTSLCVGVDGAGNVYVGGPGISGGGGGGTGKHACIVPHLVGKTLRAARHALRAARCTLGNVKRVKASRRKRNHVLSQTPRAGRRLRLGARVNVVVGR